MAIKSYQDQAELLLKEYLLADSFIPYTSIIVGISACKMVYDLTQLFSLVYFKSYSNLTKMQRVEWNNRAISTVHAIFITVISLYLVFCSDLYSDHRAELMIFQASSLSTFALGKIEKIARSVNKFAGGITAWICLFSVKPNCMHR